MKRGFSSPIQDLRLGFRLNIKRRVIWFGVARNFTKTRRYIGTPAYSVIRLRHISAEAKIALYGSTRCIKIKFASTAGMYTAGI